MEGLFSSRCFFASGTLSGKSEVILLIYFIMNLVISFCSAASLCQSCGVHNICFFVFHEVNKKLK